MAQLPERTAADTRADHIGDHNELHRLHNLLDVGGIDSINNKLNKGGDTMTGLLTLSGDPVQPLQAVNKSFMESFVFAVAGDLQADIDGKLDSTYTPTGFVRDRDGGQILMQVSSLGSVTHNLDLSLGNHKSFLLEGNPTIVFPSGLAAGVLLEFTMRLVQDVTGGRTATFNTPSWAAGSAPVLHSAPGSYDDFYFKSEDGGTTWIGYHLNGAVPTTTYGYIAGTLQAIDGTRRLPVNFSGRLVSMRVMVTTVPTGSSAIFNIRKGTGNGAPGAKLLAGAARPTIAVSANSSSEGVLSTTIAPGDYIVIDVDQIGSTVAGADATVSVGFLLD